MPSRAASLRVALVSTVTFPEEREPGFALVTVLLGNSLLSKMRKTSFCLITRCSQCACGLGVVTHYIASRLPFEFSLQQ